MDGLHLYGYARLKTGPYDLSTSVLLLDGFDVQATHQFRVICGLWLHHSLLSTYYMCAVSNIRRISWCSDIHIEAKNNHESTTLGIYILPNGPEMPKDCRSKQALIMFVSALDSFLLPLRQNF